jgi:hypothetical protein
MSSASSRDRGRVRARTFCLLLSGTLLSSVQVGQAVAQEGEPEVRTSSYVQLNAFWHQRRDMTGPRYKKITWYAGAYRTEGFFYSDLYRIVSTCERQEGQDRCRQTDLELGATTSEDDAQLVMDHRLDYGTLDGAYTLKKRGSGDGRTIGVHVELTTSGPIHRSRDQDEQWKGDCLRSRTATVESTRSGVAVGHLFGDVERNLHRTRDADLESERTTTTVWPC